MFNRMAASIERNKKGILLMIASSLCVCIGQLFWKLAASQSIIVLLLGFCFYGVGALVMIYAYRFGKLSVLQPMLSMNYALSIILGAATLNEKITALKLIGVAVITCGVILIAGGDDDK